MPNNPDLETVLLGPVLADRDCGACTACCTVLTVDTPDLKKPAGTPCEKLTAHGCSIHAVRPPICRTWFCAWRRVAAMPEEARPDRSGLLVSVNFVREPRNPLEAVSLNVRAMRDQAGIDPALTQRVLDSLCDGLVAVWYSDGSRKMLLHPDNDVAQLVLSGNPSPPHLEQEVAAWRQRYGAFLDQA
ncbi:YkgJ family cysteine cluster protein [Blastomonas sp.]|uniref:YkgJ family cysteine cluster protein n=1 Tax=Blastomonas sp. TaxID=1909299 RepID=UPI00261E4962|nr:YkgJ family cysteine cluster protein [Blastomonas sp.]MDM7955248.1 YkgJ family cysteine cluster protein [Blastomonas sp.]